MPPNSLILSSIRPDDKFKLWSVGGVFEEVADKMKNPRGVYTQRGGWDLTPEEEGEIAKMVSYCYHARRTKQYDVGDGIRDELKRKYDVSIDDRSMELRISRRRRCGCMKEIYY